MIITSQVRPNKMICRVQALVYMVKVTGNDNNSWNIHNHRPIIISLEKSDDVSHTSKAEATCHFAVENLLPEHTVQSLRPIINSYHLP